MTFPSFHLLLPLASLLLAPGGVPADGGADYKHDIPKHSGVRFMTFPSFHQDDDLYFVTATLCGWKTLFSETKYAQIILDSLCWLRTKKRMMLFAFTLLPSHLHAILKPLDLPIGRLIQNFGSFTSHRIIQTLKIENEQEYLQFFNKSARDQRNKYSIWQDIQAKNIFSEKFLAQKLLYVHSNPIKSCKPRNGDERQTEYSSYAFYESGKRCLIEIDDIREYLI